MLTINRSVVPCPAIPVFVLFHCSPPLTNQASPRGLKSPSPTPYTIICATPCPPRVLLPVNACPFTPASAYNAAVIVNNTAAAMRDVMPAAMLIH